jgi:hypothetical protein
MSYILTTNEVAVHEWMATRVVIKIPVALNDKPACRSSVKI